MTNHAAGSGRLLIKNMNYLINPGLNKKERTPHNIINEAAKYFKVDVAYLMKDERTRTRVQARGMIFKVLRDHCRLSFLQIASLFDKDHTTIIHGIRKLEDLLDVYPEIAHEFESLINHLNFYIYDLHFSDNCCPHCGRYNLVAGKGREGTGAEGTVNEETIKGNNATL